MDKLLVIHVNLATPPVILVDLQGHRVIVYLVKQLSFMIINVWQLAYLDIMGTQLIINAKSVILLV